MVSFEGLRKRSGIRLSELARESRLSEQTIRRIEKGQSVSYESVQRALNVINRTLGTSYSVEEMDDVTISE